MGNLCARGFIVLWLVVFIRNVEVHLVQGLFFSGIHCLHFEAKLAPNSSKIREKKMRSHSKAYLSEIFNKNLLKNDKIREFVETSQQILQNTEKKNLGSDDPAISRRASISHFQCRPSRPNHQWNFLIFYQKITIFLGKTNGVGRNHNSSNIFPRISSVVFRSNRL